MSTLVISEKEIAAKRIAQILSGGKSKTVKIGKIPVHSFQRKDAEWNVVGLKGHVMKLDYPSEYRSWQRVDPKDLVWAEPEKSPEKGKKIYINALTKLAKSAERIVVATDYDREGELIGVEALDAVNGTTSVFRARFSSLTKRDVERAFENLVEVDRNLAAAGESRQHVDLAWGAVLTRILSMASRTSAREVISVGRVQSPTLALIVDREKEIRAFVPEPYWEILARLGGNEPFEASHVKGRFDDKKEADASFADAQGATEAAVAAVKKTTKTEAAPSPFNTTAFQIAASRIGMTASRAMEVAERLYMAGYVSYPRTDNTVYPPDESLDDILQGLASIPSYAPLVRRLADARRPEPTRGKKTATDHPPIHPVEPADLASLKDDARKVYDLIVRRFLATLAIDAQGESTSLRLDVGGQAFKATGYRTVVAGWKGFYPFQGAEDRPLPEVQEGQSVPVDDVELLDKETQPPRRYGQGGLIAKMEELGLGTKSTRHEIIRKISSRDYIKSPSTLEPTETAFALIDGLERHADVISKPAMTAALEEDMEKVAQGQMSLADVVKDSRQMLEKAVVALVANKEAVGKQLNEALQKQARIGPCPQCGHDLIVRDARRTRKRFIGCSGWPDCTQTYPLPQMGAIESLGTACDACGSPELRLYKRASRPWDFCANMDCPKREARESQAPKTPEPAASAASGPA